MNRLQEKYQKEVIPAMLKTFSKKQVLAVARPAKVVVNVGIDRRVNTDAAKMIESMETQLATITGQKPARRGARMSIAGFKIRQGDTVGLAVTLRGNRMWEFLDKLISITLPRVKDFQGVSAKTFDAQGSYSLGIKEQIVFPEIEYDKIFRVSGLQITVVPTIRNKVQAMKMLELLGMPFEKEEKK
ncbi:MAG TPA: 50S ribosomal protein L5 [Patescibacteria group bacterium]|nr:50S ribosomal protein L5 [Patescibacteria group bacterium]